MRAAALALACVLAAAGTARAQAPDTATVLVRGPTVVACFHPVTLAQVDTDDDLATVLDDWQWHWYGAARSFRAHGVAAEARMANWVKLAIGGRLRLVRCPGVGYVLVAPGRGPKILRDVMTDAELVDAAAAFFGRPDLKIDEEGHAGHR